jgi:hypothetical protein
MPGFPVDNFISSNVEEATWGMVIQGSILAAQGELAGVVQ